MVAGINFVSGLNNVGLRRREQITQQDRLQLKAAYRLVYRSALTPRAALAEMDRQADWGAPAVAFREFVRRAINAPKPFDRGLISGRAARGLRDEQPV
jgi:acyl-[acyl carrier protein]--UDP-N-acetylglucosamine O-acyltransferase